VACFPEFRPMRSFILQNLRSDNDRPKFLRWLYKQLDDPRINPFQRIAEIWFDDSEGWRKAMVEKAGEYTKPAWAEWAQFPFFEPYKDFAGIFILDRPHSDHLQQGRGYATTR
jgi:hypothetical protein